MRIALIIERMDPSRGGRETSTAGIAEKLASRGHHPVVLCQESQWESPGVEVRPLGRVGVSRESRLKNFFRDVRKNIDTDEFDVTHAMLPIPGVDIYQPRGGTVPAQARASRRRRGFLSGGLSSFFRRLDPTRRFVAAAERDVVSDAGILCLAGSEMVSREFEQYYGRSEKVHVVFNGVDVPSVTSQERESWRNEIRREIGCGQGLVFLTVAANPELKGVPELISSFDRWRSSSDRQDSTLVVVGSGATEKCNREIDRSGVADSIIFREHTDEIFKWYSAADVCILLSWYDACSRVVLEAVRWGIPSITTVFNGAAEALSTGGGVIVESPGDIDGVVRAIGELSDPAVRNRRSKVCLQQSDQFSMDRHVDQLLETYEELKGGIK